MRATLQDLIDMKKGHVSNPVLEHEVCGGQVSYSFARDRVGCPRCGTGWTMATLYEENMQPNSPWSPPVVKR